MVFAERGAIMAATILSSPRAVEMSIYVVRAFVKLREVLASHAELARKLETLEKSVASLDANRAASLKRSTERFSRSWRRQQWSSR
jgi:hypothetical protein